MERRIKALGKGIGDTTISIFLRDMRKIWKKADPKPSPLVKLAMKKIGTKLKNKKNEKICKREKVEFSQVRDLTFAFCKKYFVKLLAFKCFYV